MTASADVVIVGGGPAGLAAAGALARSGALVHLIERRAPTDFRVGETVGGHVRHALEALGAWEAVRPVLQASVPFTEVRAAWGQDDLVARSTMLGLPGAGWHVDRTRLDAALASWARDCGAVITSSASASVTRRAGSLYVTTTETGALCAGRLIDASGRGAPASRSLRGHRWVSLDRQVAIVARLGPGPRAPEPALVLEATPDGFWYVAPQPDDGVVVAFVTDSDLLASYGARRTERFRRALPTTRHIAALAGGRDIVAGPVVARSDTGFLQDGGTSDWQAIGDARFSTDPLGGSGIARALDAVIMLTADRPFASIGLAAVSYADERGRVYLGEQRFVDATFWRRRHQVDSGGAPLDWRTYRHALAPTDALRWRGGDTTPLEAWLPPSEVKNLERRTSEPTLAHTLLSALVEATAHPPGRLLTALELAVDLGVLERAEPG